MFQLYVPPELAVNVVLAPGQIFVVPVIVGANPAATLIAALAVAVQPPLVTVTLYVVLPAGLTVMAAVVAAVFHKYVPPPVAVNVVL